MDALNQIKKKVVDVALSFNWRKRKLSESDFPSPQPLPQKKHKASSKAVGVVDDYQVFLSFRGPDTRYDFTDVLYDHMDRVGICVFRDDDEISVGEPIDTILQAIETSEICVPIFSESFASSAWCLREVERMVDLEKDVVPIFYRVSPEDVKLKTHLYGDAMVEHEAKYGKERVEKWKDALKKIVKIKGMEVSTKTSYTEFCKKFINEVLTKLKPRNNRNDTDHLVGMEAQIGCVLKLLDIESQDVRYIGIYGMGGIGKTTLAKVIFQKLSIAFEGSCFLDDVRESALEELQKKLQDDLLSRSQRGSNFSRDKGKMFYKKKVLVVLDDVDKLEQVERLTGKSCWFGCGSRIIVTTRHENILKQYGELHHSFEMKTLENCQALELFKWHAFRNDPPIFDDLSREIVSTAEGLPLALEVLGSRLRISKDEKVWRDMKERSRKIQDEGLKDRLKISYDALEHENKQIFLDIACLPIMREKEKLLHMWEAMEFYPNFGIEVLRSMSLIKIVEDDKIWMHSQLRDLGKNIVREESIEHPWKRSRLWDYKEAWEVLSSKEEKENVEVLCAVGISNLNLTREHFVSFRRLRYLELVGANIEGDLRSLLRNLMWLSLHLCPSNFNSTILYLKNLVILDFSHSFIDETWGGWSKLQGLNQLKVLDLSNCHKLTRTPLFYESNTLRRLILRGCSRLRNIHGSIIKLKGLEYLHLDDCYSLRGLPDEIACLKNLKEIVVTSTCSGILRRTFNLPKAIGNLSSLEVLKLQGLAISEIPYSIGGLVKLKYLRLKRCSKLKELPESLGDLKSLVELDLSRTTVSLLPDSIGYLCELKSINLSYSKIKKLPRSIGMMKKLESINADFCLLEDVPMEIGELSGLRTLRLFTSRHVPCSLQKVVDLSKLSNLSQLVILNVKDYRGPQQLRDSYLQGIEMLTKLESLIVSILSISNLSFDLGCLTQLKVLGLYFPRNLDCVETTACMKLPDLSNLNLRTLGLDCCLIKEGLERLGI